MALPGGMATTRPPRAELTVFDFAAISLMVQFPVRATPTSCSNWPGTSPIPGPLNMAARLVVNPGSSGSGRSSTASRSATFSEEYIIFQVGDVATRLDRRQHSTGSPGLIRLEAGPLSPPRSARPPGWASPTRPTTWSCSTGPPGSWPTVDCADTLQVIEFANVQLLEFRHIDDRLDDRLEAAYRLIHAERGRRPPAEPSGGPIRRRVRSVRELEIEATSLFERADNNLKLIGDQYLSRVFDLARTRFHLGEWQQSIRRKLEVVGDVYDLLVQQAGGTRMEVLEIIVVILIALEILLALIRH